MVDRAAMSDAGGTSADDQYFNAAVDVRVAKMRRFIDQMNAPSVTEALRKLRDAFPEAPLEERVRALKYSRH